jgi:hypothetical protein
MAGGGNSGSSLETNSGVHDPTPTSSSRERKLSVTRTFAAIQKLGFPRALASATE